ncbi:chromosomal replication initiator protein DnaA [bacterium]|nr:chromosomal replication initiator protein DnaA [bacterium]
MPPHVYHSLVESTPFEGDSETALELRFQDLFSKEGFEQKCLPALRQVLQDLQLPQTQVKLSITQTPSVEAEPLALEWDRRNPFDPQYSFETFVIGSSNQFAHAACQAVSKQPGLCYNPLFIFGGAGLGKTHLLRAIGHAICSQNPSAKILFLTSETFTNELIQAIRTDRMKDFREKYRSRCDVLLIDDVHFLAGKERTQEEFFYTFNYLHEARKQIVITSDRYPKDIAGLENRLQTRFEWGLVADVQPPEIETRIAILKNKAEKENIPLPDGVAQYIATHITTNIRELEGSLHRLQAYASLTDVPISETLARQTLKDIAPKVKHELTADAILKLVALQFNLRTTDIRSEKRTRKLTIPRQICMYLMRRHLLMSYPEIGKFMGGKDHTTILHGVTRIGDLMRTDPEVLKATTSVESLIR